MPSLRKLLTVGLMLVALNLILWEWFDAGVPLFISANVLLIFLVVIHALVYPSVPDERRDPYRRYAHSEGGYNSPRHENNVPRTVPTYVPPKQVDANSTSIEARLESIASWLSSIDDRLERIQADVATLRKRPTRDLNKTFPDSKASPQPRLRDGSSNKTELVASKHKDAFFDAACHAYGKLAAEGLRSLPIEPIFVVLDIDSSARTEVVGEVQRHFWQSENKQSEFVVFTKDPTEAWLFPNPRISFTEAMKYVFPFLSYENFEEYTNEIEPKRVKQISPERWEMVTDGKP